MSEEEIKQLKREEQEKTEPADPSKRNKRSKRTSKRQSKGSSLFGPIVLIGIGLYFLLVNLGVVDGTLHWDVLFSWWPLFLIFIGLNIIVQQLPGLLGRLVEGLLGLTAVTVFGSLLILGTQTPILGTYNLPSAAINEIPVDVSLRSGVNRAEISLDFNAAPAQIEALAEGDALIRGTAFTAGEVKIEQNSRGDEVSVRPTSGWSWGMRSGAYTAVHQWQLGLSPTIPLDLNFDLSSGQARLDLSGLQLQNLVIEGGSGATTLTLPDGGDYDMRYDVGSGAVWMTLPSRGQHRFEIEGGSGGVNIILPAQIEARVTVESGSGTLSISQQFRESHGRGDTRIYTTPNFDSSGSNYIDLQIDMGSGSISISPEAGQ